MPELLSRLASCPICQGALRWGETLECQACGRVYERKHGVPNLSVELSEYQRRQIEFFEGHEDVEYETIRPYGLPRFHGWLLREKVRRGTGGLRRRFAGATVLVVCGGSGLDAQLVVDLGGRVITSDISAEASARAVERARRFGFELEAIAATAERLPFPDRSVDIAFVHDGLHHLDDPLEGLREMARVARVAVSVNEPADALLTRGAIRLGQAEAVEEAGNRVERLRLTDVERTLDASGFDVVAASRYALFYRHTPGLPSRVFSLPLLFAPATAALRLGNTLFGRLGNKLTVQAVRRAEER